ncbi:hypothetical protein [Saccharothrix yanglingensis]|uniref:hypothetical protein n=1 Tax=Saccharothrix yanglingensis TaxID=659496 RepID=UPI0027D2F844|nr:hypothetical protein [Saccharothrix yanglingensis]
MSTTTETEYVGEDVPTDVIDTEDVLDQQEQQDGDKNEPATPDCVGGGCVDTKPKS